MELEFFSTICDHQDTESGSFEAGMIIYEPIFTHKNIKGYIGQLYTYYTIWEQNIVAVPHIYWARGICLLFCDQQDVESE